MAESRSKSQVAKTNDSSIVSKLSMSELGYYHDPFLKYFVAKPSRRSPLINRGYYIRAKAIEYMITGFLKECASLASAAQIISLGAGFDTLYFRFKDLLAQFNCNVFEVDFPSVMSRKTDIILSSQELLKLVSPVEVAEGVLKCSNYVVVGCDLTDLTKLDKLLTVCGVDYSVPSLVLSECVLTYIEPHRVDSILRWISKAFCHPMFCTYEQIHPDDGFGQVMQKHFVSIGSPLKNIKEYPCAFSQEKRLLKTGFSCSASIDMSRFFHTLLDLDKHRINLIEPFDEFEGLFLKCNHYLLLCAANGNCGHIPRRLLPTPTELEAPPHGIIDAVCISLTESSTVIKRFGHSSVCLQNGDVVIIGGFGVSDRSDTHGRLNDVVLFRSSSTGGASTCRSLASFGELPDGIVYHQAVLLQDGTILISGGRASPNKPSRDFFIITIINDSTCFWKRLKLDPDSDIPSLRWRHTATHVMHEGKECVLIAGGRAQSEQALDDIFLIRCSKWTCEQGYRVSAIVECMVIEDGIKTTKQGVRQFLKHYAKYKTIARKPGSGVVAKLSPEIQQIIEDAMCEDDETTATQLQARLALNDVYVSLATIVRNRHQLGWIFRGSAYCQLIRQSNKEKRLIWARAFLHDNFEDVIWSDETTVQLETHRRFCYRKEGEQPRPKPRPKHPIKVHLWAGISRKGATAVCVFEGIMAAPLYCKILEKHSYHSCNKGFHHHAPIVSCKTMTQSTHLVLLKTSIPGME